MIVGVLVLEETFSLLKLSGGVLILISVVLIAASKKRPSIASE